MPDSPSTPPVQPATGAQQDAEPPQRPGIKGGIRERIARLVGFRSITPADVSADAEAAAEATPSEIRLRLRKFETSSVRGVMTSRVDTIAVEETATLAEVLQLFATEVHSRMPVYQESLDEPLGFIHIKDVVAEVVRQGWSAEVLASRPLKRLVRDILFVPESTRLPDLLVQMQASRIHIAIVIDEYGGTGGMVCLEDIVEEIVGDIEDEHDETAPVIVRRARNVWEVDGLAEIEDIERETGLAISVKDFEDDVGTIGGLAAALAGRMPQAGEVIDHPGGLKLEVVEADPRRVTRVRVRGPAARPAAAPLADAPPRRIDPNQA
jgi:CBS domain containing-hemolysin-like protein